jgi:hypothetical protein
VAWIGLEETQEDHDFFVKCMGFLSRITLTPNKRTVFFCANHVMNLEILEQWYSQ